MTEPTHCPRCHKTDIVRRKRYAATARAPLHLLLLLGLYNLLALLLRPAGPDMFVVLGLPDAPFASQV